MKVCITLLLSCALSSVLFAETVEVNNHTYPKSETAFETEWTLVGTHHFKYKIFFSVFTGAYYEPASGEGERLKFTYTRSIQADDLRKQAMKHLQATQPEEVLASYSNLTKEIQAAYEDVTDNDSYTLTVLPNQGIWLARNEEVVYHSDNAEFGDWYLDIWLGDPPIDEGLKKDLLNE